MHCTARFNQPLSIDCHLLFIQNVDTESVDYLFGVFNDDEFRYRLDIQDDPDDEQPRLLEMTRAALEVVSRNDDGFVLFVEV